MVKPKSLRDLTKYLTEMNSYLVHQVIDEVTLQHLPLYYDDDHVNRLGSDQIIKALIKRLE